MKQPEDSRTLELSLEEQKRGRGRPKKVDALTGAQRAKLYRDRNRAANIAPRLTRDVTINPRSATVNPELEALRTQLELAEAERNAAYAENTRLKAELHRIPKQVVDEVSMTMLSKELELANTINERLAIDHKSINAQITRLKEELAAAYEENLQLKVAANMTAKAKPQRASRK